MSLFGDDPRWLDLQDQINDLQTQVNHINSRLSKKEIVAKDAIEGLRDKIKDEVTFDHPVGIYRVQLSNPTQDKYDILTKKSDIEKVLNEAKKETNSFAEGNAVKTLCSSFACYASGSCIPCHSVEWHEGFEKDEDSKQVKAYDIHYVAFRVRDISTVSKIYEFEPKDDSNE